MGGGSGVTTPGGWAGRLTQRWVRLYTRSAPAGDTVDRRAEMESDLWEQVATRTASGAPPGRIRRELVGRALRGVPADVAWRLEVEQSPGRLRWHVQHPSTVLLSTWAILLPINLVADGFAARRETMERGRLLGCRDGSSRGVHDRLRPGVARAASEGGSASSAEVGAGLAGRRPVRDGRRICVLGDLEVRTCTVVVDLVPRVGGLGAPCHRVRAARRVCVHEARGS